MTVYSPSFSLYPQSSPCVDFPVFTAGPGTIPFVSLPRPFFPSLGFKTTNYSPGRLWFWKMPRKWDRPLFPGSRNLLIQILMCFMNKQVRYQGDKASRSNMTSHPLPSVRGNDGQLSEVATAEPNHVETNNENFPTCLPI